MRVFTVYSRVSIRTYCNPLMNEFIIHLSGDWYWLSMLKPCTYHSGRLIFYFPRTPLQKTDAEVLSNQHTHELAPQRQTFAELDVFCQAAARRKTAEAIVYNTMIEVARCFPIQGYRCELFTFKISCKMWQNDIYFMLNWVFVNSIR